MELKKILFVVSNISIGGAQRVTMILMDYFKKQGIEPILVAIGKSEGNYSFDDQYKVILLDQRGTFEILKTIKKMKKVFLDEKPDVIITMGVPTCIYSVLAVKGTKIPHIISERNDPRHFLGKKSTEKISRTLMRFAEGYVFQTEDAKNFYSQKIREKSCVISNPFIGKNLPQVVENKKYKIVTMGRLTAQKNHKLLIDSFKNVVDKYPKAELYIYGNGELKSYTQNLIKEKKLTENIFLMDACNDVHEKIKDATMFVLSSDFEGIPNALIEAMAMGLPVISTDCPCGGPKSLIENKKNGLLVPVNEIKELSSAMLQLIEDISLRNKLSINGKKIVEILDASLIGNKWLYYIKNIVENN